MVKRCLIFKQKEIAVIADVHKNMATWFSEKKSYGSTLHVQFCLRPEFVYPKPTFSKKTELALQMEACKGGGVCIWNTVSYCLVGVRVSTC